MPGLDCSLSLSLSLSAFLTLVTPAPVQAADKTWNAGSSSWFTGTNWDPNGEPTSGDALVINNGGTAEIATQSASCQYLRLGYAVSGTGYVSMTSGSLSAAGGIVVGTSGQGGFTQTGGSVNGNITFGNDLSGQGTYTMSQGEGDPPSIDSAVMFVGLYGTGTFEQHCGEVNVTGSTYFFDIAVIRGPGSPHEPHGTYRLYDGATLNVTGDSTPYVNKTAIIGDEGPGVFELRGGTLNFSSCEVWLGYQNNWQGGLHFLGDGLLKVTGGTLNVSGTMYVSAGGVGHGGRGKVVVTGSPESLTIHGMTIGDRGGEGGVLQIGDAEDAEKGRIDAVLHLYHILFGASATYEVQEPGQTLSYCTLGMELWDSRFVNKSVVIKNEQGQPVSTCLPGLGRTTAVFNYLDNDGENAGIKQFEAAGKLVVDVGALDEDDFGDVNFALKELVVGYYDLDDPPGEAPDTFGPVTLEIMEGHDNQADDVGQQVVPEALYVLKLAIAPGGTFKTTDSILQKDIYFVHFPGEQGTQYPKKLYMGDANLDGEVGFADYQIWEAHFLYGPGLNWQDADFNGDRQVDFDDYAFLDANWGSGQRGDGQARALPVVKDYDEDGDIDGDDIRLMHDLEEEQSDAVNTNPQENRHEEYAINARGFLGLAYLFGLALVLCLCRRHDLAA